ncbi:MAG: DUF1761 domain-containing protein [Candidatus Marinimicrobia bacterium]|jgi:hypothetical protein|nr:DUF1761 domain-containing protein [Candidatus Neomarinimicrobiota bacterium]MBT3575488.1 DUF1761 domain-containing protein [Candidatus Neomarinimicrobiota bacterium]MBT3679585.1 DUF1761 domain-containing protein [Candidatus Neomarinimicrobiota bacterium]MBT3950542.1 DUF1761 domain-containing protein [Candidatus Neomarinimicrobiota bacterium]MBT4253471.1 DUF1761 domain-containing protein [Candidatus Neomarinimicrobiota bacterium]
MLTFDVNWIAIAVLVIANMALGAIWYGPLFGKPWMEATGIKMDDMEGKNMMPPYAVAIMNSFFMAFFMANVIAWTSTASLGGGLLLGLFMWLGFTGLSFGVNHAFEMRSLHLWFINSGMYLIGLLIMGAVLAIW